jgi:hypothetical protein
MMPKRIDNTPHAPAIRLVFDRPDNFGPYSHGLRMHRVGIVTTSTMRTAPQF